LTHIATSLANPDMIDHVVANLWDRGAQELEILGVSRERAVEMMNDCREAGNPTLAWSVDGVPVFVTGLLPTGPGVMCSWFLATRRFHAFQRRITMTLWRELERVAEERQLREIEIYSTCVHPRAARWFQALGFVLDVDRHSSPRTRTYRFVRRFTGG